MEAEWAVGSSVIRFSAHVQHDIRTIKPSKCAYIVGVNLYVKHRAKCEAVANIQDTQMAMLRNNGHV
jgi:hypothetical protein